MLGLIRLLKAFGLLADEVEGLARTTREANHGLRARLGLDNPDRAQLPGEVVEAPEPEPEPANGKGRRRK